MAVGADGLVIAGIVGAIAVGTNQIWADHPVWGYFIAICFFVFVYTGAHEAIISDQNK